MSGAEFHFRGTARLNVKDYFEICIPTIKLRWYIPPSRFPSSRPSHPGKRKSCRHRAEGMSWEQILFDDREGSFCSLIPTQAAPSLQHSHTHTHTAPNKSNWMSRGRCQLSVVLSYQFTCLTGKARNVLVLVYRGILIF